MFKTSRLKTFVFNIKKKNVCFKYIYILIQKELYGNFPHAPNFNFKCLLTVFIVDSITLNFPFDFYP